MKTGLVDSLIVEWAEDKDNEEKRKRLLSAITKYFSAEDNEEDEEFFDEELEEEEKIGKPIKFIIGNDKEEDFIEITDEEKGEEEKKQVTEFFNEEDFEKIEQELIEEKAKKQKEYTLITAMKEILEDSKPPSFELSTPISYIQQKIDISASEALILAILADDGILAERPYRYTVIKSLLLRKFDFYLHYFLEQKIIQKRYDDFDKKTHYYIPFDVKITEKEALVLSIFSMGDLLSERKYCFNSVTKKLIFQKLNLVLRTLSQKQLINERYENQDNWGNDGTVEYYIPETIRTHILHNKTISPKIDNLTNDELGSNIIQLFTRAIEDRLPLVVIEEAIYFLLKRNTHLLGAKRMCEFPNQIVICYLCCYCISPFIEKIDGVISKQLANFLDDFNTNNISRYRFRGLKNLIEKEYVQILEKGNSKTIKLTEAGKEYFRAEEVFSKVKYKSQYKKKEWKIN